MLKNPIMVAAGTYGSEFIDYIPLERLGAFITKTITVTPREGNPQPRVFETASGLLNSMGLENVGINEFIKSHLPLFNYITPLIVSIAGDSEIEYLQIASRLNYENMVDGIEVNISCPNVQGGCAIGFSPTLTYELIREIRKLFHKNIIVKLTPNTMDIGYVAKAAESAGADAISLVNTFLGMAIDINTRHSRLSRPFAGLSGPAIKPLALRLVWEVCRQVSIPVIGIGGIQTGEDAVEFILAGASAVQIGSASFRDYNAPIKILDELICLLGKQGVENIKQLIGGFVID
jgi:dihydroorotate dehydrogenase (NAD+) catalytic subunit